ncbi:MAG: NFACT family protein [Clostridia bacterium]|nr:NFACT family protein [Clostridia bacterium]
MPSDYITLHALAEELNDRLSGGKIRRICQPEKDEITLSIFTGRTNLLLVISADPNSPRIHLTTVKKENPYAAPPLLMILRKYVGAAVVKGISAIANDRILEIALNARNELFDDEDFYLVCELMGRYSNIILLDSDRRILDSLYKLVPDEKQRREILIGARYLPPEQNKIFIGDETLLCKALRETDRPYRDFLTKETSGTSSAGAEQILSVAEKEGGVFPENVARIARAYSDIYHSPYFRPCIKVGKTADFYPYDCSFAETEPRDSLNDCADEVFSLLDRNARLHASSKNLERILNAAIKKAKNSIQAISEKLADESRSEEIRVTAELITSNLYKIKPHDRSVEVFDYYANENRIIELDPSMTPSAYAQKLYKKYAKLKRGKEINETLLAQNEANLMYYETLLTQLKLAETQEDIAITEEEMRQAGLLRAAKKERNKKALPSYMIFEAGGYEILCGKGGIQNELITFKVAKERDLWLHVAKSHGSHVIVLSEKNATIPEMVLLIAAEIAAYYSDRRTDVSVPIDYTARRNVRRHPAKKVGLVYYSDYKTIDVVPNAHPELKK